MPGSAIESDTFQLPQEQSKPEVSITQNLGDGIFNVATNLPYLLELNDFDPTQPGEREKAVYGMNNTTRKARDRWLRHTAAVIRSGHQSEVQQAYRDFAQSKGLHVELAREILIYDVEVSLAL